MSEFLFQSEGVGVAMVGAGDVRMRRTRDLAIDRFVGRIARTVRGAARPSPRPVVARLAQSD